MVKRLTEVELLPWASATSQKGRIGPLPYQVINLDRETNDFQHLEVLKRNRKKRHRYGEIFVESVACINALVEAGWYVTSIAYNGEHELSSWAKGIIAESNPERVYRLTSALMEKLSDRSDPSELIVTAKIQRRTLRDIVVNDGSVVVIFDRPSNHGNLGSVIRSSDAFGVSGVITTGHSVDIYDPIVLRASLGAFFHIPVTYCPSMTELKGWIGRMKQKMPKLRVIGTSPSATRWLYDLDLTGPVIMIVGNETFGIGKSLAEVADEMVAIPMDGRVDSLNAACAATISLYEVVRQRRLSIG